MGALRGMGAFRLCRGKRVPGRPLLVPPRAGAGDGGGVRPGHHGRHRPYRGGSALPGRLDARAERGARLGHPTPRRPLDLRPSVRRRGETSRSLCGPAPRRPRSDGLWRICHPGAAADGRGRWAGAPDCGKCGPSRGLRAKLPGAVTRTVERSTLRASSRFSSRRGRRAPSWTHAVRGVFRARRPDEPRGWGRHV